MAPWVESARNHFFDFTPPVDWGGGLRGPHPLGLTPLKNFLKAIARLKHPIDLGILAKNHRSTPTRFRVIIQNMGRGPVRPPPSQRKVSLKRMKKCRFYVLSHISITYLVSSKKIISPNRALNLLFNEYKMSAISSMNHLQRPLRVKKLDFGQWKIGSSTLGGAIF